MPDFDFGFGGTNTDETVDTPINEAKEDVTDLNGDKPVDKAGNEVTELNTTVTDDKDVNDDVKPYYEAGTAIEYNNASYTVDEKGNLVDSKGNIFKDAKDVKSWIESLDTVEENNDNSSFGIKEIQEALGVEIVDDNDNKIEFDNTPDGIKSYVTEVINNSKQQIVDDTISALYNKYPIVEQVINYYVANGNSLDGFNEVRDRSNIQLDINNEQQCEAIIREAWKESNRKGSIDSYIQYLRSQNLLGTTAQEELNAMIERDKEYQVNLAKKAEEEENKRYEAEKAYWNNINNIIESKTIGKYKLPDIIIRNHNGQKTSATTKDFFNYIYQVDKYGRSAYQNDIARDKPEDRLVNDLLAAYLKFTGGTFESLVNMAINEEKVKTIRLKSKTTPRSKVNVTPPNKETKVSDMDFGF